MKNFVVTIFLFFIVFCSYNANAQTGEITHLDHYLYAHDSIIYANKDSSDYYIVENLGPNINSAHMESGPHITKDGNSLYFFRAGHPENITPESQDIWVSHLLPDSTWSLAEHLTEINNHDDNGIHSITPDGKKVLLLGKYLKNNTSVEGVSFSEKMPDGKWSFPEPLKIHRFKIKELDHKHHDHRTSYYMNDQENVVVIAMPSKHSVGNQDLYVTFKKTKGRKGRRTYWTHPKDMGRVVNTKGHEATAFIASDGKTMYFSSDGHKNSLGGFDIYKTERLDSTWTNWSEPVNIGAPFNTKDDEFYFSTPASSDYAYLAHHFIGEDSLPHSDIVRIKLHEHKPNPVVTLNIKVYDDSTKLPINAVVKFYKQPGKVPFTDEIEVDTSGVKHTLPCDGQYYLEVKAEGYMSEFLDLYLDCEDFEERDQTIYIKPKREGLKFEVKNIYFEFNKATLLPESFPELDKLVDIMTGAPDIKVEISGHTDSRGRDSYNLELSDARARSVVNYLVEHGVPAKQLVAKGYGEKHLKNHCKNGIRCSEADHAVNRRVEFKVLNVK